MAESHLSTTSGSAGSFQTSANSNDGNGERASGAALAGLKEKLTDAQDVVKSKYRVVSESTDDFVHDSPWKAVAMALIGGLIIGMLAAR